MRSILLVDDHAVVRNGLKQILVEHLDLVVFGRASGIFIEKQLSHGNGFIAG